MSLILDCFSVFGFQGTVLFRQGTMLASFPFSVAFLYSSKYSVLTRSSSYLLQSFDDGDREIRTLDPLLARQVLSQLSYAPVSGSHSLVHPPVGLSGLEPPTSRLSGVRSNRLSYKPKVKSLQPSLCSLFFLQVFFTCFILAATCSPMPSPA